MLCGGKRGTNTFAPICLSAAEIYHYSQAEELWKTRDRSSLEETLALTDQLVKLLDPDQAASLVLKVEREYWQSRNRAAQVQKNRQDRLGMGWANHDHHTFRSSRKNFHLLVKIFETLGFYCRERFYAGDEAGWGAQVMENSNARLVLFLDVDLTPEEVIQDFAHEPLPEVKSLGTVGLWCALHGDSILEAGMHHLEAQFAFETLIQDLKAYGVAMMKPFSDFDYLKQAFTKGEKWPVKLDKLTILVNSGQISQEQAAKFQQEEAIGSHLENLQRKAGYKGFNQHNVSQIIKETDPRKSL